jgi:hypothetical protein
MAGLRRILLVLILAFAAMLMEGCGAACGDPSWLLRVAGDSIGNYTAPPEVSASGQVCVTRSFGD